MGMAHDDLADDLSNLEPFKKILESGLSEDDTISALENLIAEKGDRFNPLRDFTAIPSNLLPIEENLEMIKSKLETDKVQPSLKRSLMNIAAKKGNFRVLKFLIEKKEEFIKKHKKNLNPLLIDLDLVLNNPMSYAIESLEPTHTVIDYLMSKREILYARLNNKSFQHNIDKSVFESLKYQKRKQAALILIQKVLTNLKLSPNDSLLTEIMNNLNEPPEKHPELNNEFKKIDFIFRVIKKGKLLPLSQKLIENGWFKPEQLDKIDNESRFASILRIYSEFYPETKDNPENDPELVEAIQSFVVNSQRLSEIILGENFPYREFVQNIINQEKKRRNDLVDTLIKISKNTAKMTIDTALDTALMPIEFSEEFEKKFEPKDEDTDELKKEKDNLKINLINIIKYAEPFLANALRRSINEILLKKDKETKLNEMEKIIQRESMAETIQNKNQMESIIQSINEAQMLEIFSYLYDAYRMDNTNKKIVQFLGKSLFGHKKDWVKKQESLEEKENSETIAIGLDDLDKLDEQEQLKQIKTRLNEIEDSPETYIKANLPILKENLLNYLQEQYDLQKKEKIEQEINSSKKKLKP